MNSSFLQVSVFKDNPVRQGIDRVGFFMMMKIKIMIFKMKMKTRYDEKVKMILQNNNFKGCRCCGGSAREC